MFNTILNNISVVVWRSVLLAEETEEHIKSLRQSTKSMTNFIA